jgi:hypothetical protein
MDASLDVAYSRRYTYAASCRVACSVPRLGLLLSRRLAFRKRAPLLPPLEAGVLVSALHDVVGSSLLLLSSFYAACLNVFDRVSDCGLRPQPSHLCYETGNVNKAAPQSGYTPVTPWHSQEQQTHLSCLIAWLACPRVGLLKRRASYATPYFVSSSPYLVSVSFHRSSRLRLGITKGAAREHVRW